MDRLLFAFLLLIACGCQSAKPHVVAKIVVNHGDVACELGGEWK